MAVIGGRIGRGGSVAGHMPPPRPGDKGLPPLRKIPFQVLGTQGSHTFGRSRSRSSAGVGAGLRAGVRVGAGAGAGAELEAQVGSGEGLIVELKHLHVLPLQKKLSKCAIEYESRAKPVYLPNIMTFLFILTRDCSLQCSVGLG